MSAPSWAINGKPTASVRSTCATPCGRHGYVADTVETACDWPKVKGMMQGVEQAAIDALAAFGDKVHTYTHLSHVYPQGSSVYTTFVWKMAGFRLQHASWQAMKHAVSEAICSHGGTISHQHGVGATMRPACRWKSSRSAWRRWRHCSSSSIRMV